VGVNLRQNFGDEIQLSLRNRFNQEPPIVAEEQERARSPSAFTRTKYLVAVLVGVERLQNLVVVYAVKQAQSLEDRSGVSSDRGALQLSEVCLCFIRGGVKHQVIETV